MSPYSPPNASGRFFIIAYKLIFGLVESILGLGIIIFGTKYYQLYLSFQSQELLEDPHDLLATIGNSVVPYIIDHRTYIVLMLLLLGLVKVAGAIGLIYQKRWGVDLLLGLTIVLLPFQFYNLIFHHSLIDLFYIFIGIYIALYLTNYHPWDYTSRLIKGMKK
jgi:uncharacterized membrane protein